MNSEHEWIESAIEDEWLESIGFRPERTKQGHDAPVLRVSSAIGDGHWAIRLLPTTEPYSEEWLVELIYCDGPAESPEETDWARSVGCAEPYSKEGQLGHLIQHICGFDWHTRAPHFHGNDRSST